MRPQGVGPDESVAVIDVLRFSSTVAHALSVGCEGVTPMGEIEPARQRARQLGALLGGEREGLPPEGFDLGNSPESYTAETCGGRPLVMTTTNGTRAVAAVPGAARVLCASLVSAEASARALAEAGDDVILLCAGTRGEVAADDVAAAGCLAGSLALMAAATPGDGARTAIALFDAWKHDLLGLLRRSRSGRRLAGIGLDADLVFCSRVDALPVVATLDEGGTFRSS